MAKGIYEAYALKFAWRDIPRSSNFLGGDPHNAPMPMDYMFWLVRNEFHTILLDVGFTAQVSAKRGRTYLRTPRDTLAMMGISPKDVTDVIISHLHYDHVGTLNDFPNARFHIQDTEMAYATGRYMASHQFNHSFEVDDVITLVRLVYDNRVMFHNGVDQIAPGITVHHIGGHSKGLQCVRVMTKRGWVVLAADCVHYYEHIETGRFFRTVFNVGEMLDGYQTIRGLAESLRHIVPGHDPLVIERYPAASAELKGIVAQLDLAPNE